MHTALTPTLPFALATVDSASSISPEGPNPCPRPMAAGTSSLTAKSTTTSNFAATSKPAGPPSALNPTRRSSCKRGQKMEPPAYLVSTACSPLPSGTLLKNASRSSVTPSESNPSTMPTTVGNFSLPPNFAPFSAIPIFRLAWTPLRSTSTSPSATSPPLHRLCRRAQARAWPTSLLVSRRSPIRILLRPADRRQSRGRRHLR